jgi:hypothetical protein
MNAHFVSVKFVHQTLQCESLQSALESEVHLVNLLSKAHQSTLQSEVHEINYKVHAYDV